MDINASYGANPFVQAAQGLDVGSTSGQVDTLAKKGTSSLYGLSNDDFMKIFLAQLQNQDPSSPVDDSQFLNQMAQMTMIDTLQQVQQSLSGSQLAQSANLIGKQITGIDVDGNRIAGIVDRVVQSTDAGLVLMVGNQAVKPESIETVNVPAAS